MTWFASIQTLTDLKKSFHDLARRYHPDTGNPEASNAKMKEINAAYTARFEELKRKQNAQAAANPDGPAKATTEAPEEFIEIVSALLRLDGLTVELCGCWLWISGETRKHKDALKAAGCRWAAQKKMWSWHHAEDGSWHYRGKKSIDEIRTKYGSTTFSAADRAALPM